MLFARKRMRYGDFIKRFDEFRRPLEQKYRVMITQEEDARHQVHILFTIPEQTGLDARKMAILSDRYVDLYRAVRESGLDGIYVYHERGEVL